MSSLNLPPCQLKFQQEDGHVSVWDQVRQRYVAFTPEESVRQHFVDYMIHTLGYPATHLMNEVTVDLNGLSRRCDTVAYDRNLVPKVIVEYKAPTVTITRTVFEQISRYNLVLKVDYLIVTNGMKHYCVKMDYEKGDYKFVTALPDYSIIK